MGGGIRQVADGGVGMLLNGGGHNVYEFDYLSHGGGYWCGLGFARDFGGDSNASSPARIFMAATARKPVQRFGCGWGCHYAQGFCFDDKGHSTFEGSIMGSGMGWDCSLGALCVFGGNNHFEAADSLVQGCGAQGSLGILYQYGDGSEFKGYGQGYALVELDVPQRLRVRRQLQFPGELRHRQHVRLRRPGTLDHPARHFRRIPHQPAPPDQATPRPSGPAKNHGRAVITRQGGADGHRARPGRAKTHRETARETVGLGVGIRPSPYDRNTHF